MTNTLKDEIINVLNKSSPLTFRDLYKNHPSIQKLTTPKPDPANQMREVKRVCNKLVLENILKDTTGRTDGKGTGPYELASLKKQASPQKENKSLFEKKEKKPQIQVKIEKPMQKEELEKARTTKSPSVSQFPILYQKTATGAINQWRVWTEGDTIYTEYGQMGGKLQVTPGQVAEATNVGRSNERNPEEQAIFEADSMMKKQLRLKYSKTIEEANKIRIQPMLASDGKKVKNIPFPVDVQRKYDGLRAMRVFVDGKQKLLSRGNKYYDLEHIEKELSQILPDNMMSDGEFYIHGISLQNINSLVKKPQAGSEDIEYHIYDMPSQQVWSERKKLLESFTSTSKIKFVETFKANSIAEIEDLHDQFINEGYEGAIIRLQDGAYAFGKRSKKLLKWKSFEDKEFKIVAMERGTGKYSECPIFTCENDLNDALFNVTPMGTMQEKKEMLDKSNIGKLLTVKFIGRTDDFIPKFAVGKTIRPVEDLPK